MNAEHLLSERATITDRVPRVVAGELVRDGYGNVIVDPVTRTGVPCWHEQTQRSEIAGGSDVASETWELYLGAGDPIGASAQVTIAGETFEVDGRPWQTRNPRTGAQGLVQATLQRTDG